MNSLLVIFVPLLLILSAGGFFMLMAALLIAPEAYEDENGFHLAGERQPDVLLLAAIDPLCTP